MKEKKLYFYLSFIRVIACICIVILHSFKYASAIAQSGAYEIFASQMTVSSIVQYLMNWAVPCFVMVTGALMLDNDRQITYKKLFSKYILRMVVTILIFSVLFQFIDTLLAEQPLGFYTLASGLKNAAFNKSWIHMWYLYMVIAVYLMLPIYRKVTSDINKKDMLYLLILYGVFLIAVDVISNVCYSNVIMNQNNYTSSELINAINEVRYPALYIFVQKVWPLYLFLGYAIHKEIIKIKPIASTIMLVTGVLSVIIFSVIAQNTTNVNVQTICNVICGFNSSPVYLLMSAGVFSLFHWYGNLKTDILKKLIQTIDKCSFGIYLIHLIPIKVVIAKLKFDPYAYGGVFRVFIFSLAATLISFTAVYILKKIPLIKRLF